MSTDNNGTLIINTIVSLLADEVLKRIEPRLKEAEVKIEQAIDEIKAQQEAVPFDIKEVAMKVNEMIDVDDLIDQIKDGLSVEEMVAEEIASVDLRRRVRDEIRDLTFSVTVD